MEGLGVSELASITRNDAGAGDQTLEAGLGDLVTVSLLVRPP